MPLLALGFRPFFLIAGIFAVLAIALWAVVYPAHVVLPLQGISSFQWHAHEMIYGYSVAVISGFLLTAVYNWTGIQTPRDWALATLVALWLVGRVALACGLLLVAGVFDALFLASLCVAVGRPLIQAKQWKQMAILGKLIFLLVLNCLFYLGALGVVEQGIYWGIYGGLYVVVGLIMMMGRRLLPFFIERGVENPKPVYNSQWVDIASLILFVIFFVSELMARSQALSAYVALLLFIVNAFRLLRWNQPGIWQKPLLWSLYFSLWCIALGFLLFSGSYFWGLSKYVAIHAFAYGGIGTITLAMMARVSLGHTGRMIGSPPAALMPTFGLLFAGTLLRVACPLLLPQHYALWMMLSQLCWIVAFTIFTVIYFPMLTRPRVDGKDG